jgi:uncharacterized membrane protein YdbT with pleckstrin-like domain
MAAEQQVWSGSPSQWINTSKYLVCALASLTVILAIVAIPFAIWYWLVVRNTKYELTDERLKIHTGVLSKKTEDLELFRVKDTKLEQPFLLRLVGLGNVVLLSSDSTTPEVTIRAVRDSANLREKVRQLVESRRASKRVRVSELE